MRLIIVLLFSTFFLFPKNNFAISDTLLCLNFDEDFSDKSGRNNFIEIFGAKLGPDRFGRKNRAGLFDAEGQYVYVNKAFDIPVYTVSLWFKVHKYDTWWSSILVWDCPILEHGNLTIHFREFAGRLRMIPFVASTRPIVNIEDKVWNHFVVVRNGTEGAVFLNGKLIRRFSVYFNVSEHGDNAIVIGNCRDLTAYQFYGQVDDVLILNRPLDHKEILDLYPSFYKDSFHLLKPDTGDGYIHPFKNQIYGGFRLFSDSLHFELYDYKNRMHKNWIFDYSKTNFFLKKLIPLRIFFDINLNRTFLVNKIYVRRKKYITYKDYYHDAHPLPNP